ncbi:hypothetical protein HMI55_003468, partial [Coelomomyces lativittatus]
MPSEEAELVLDDLLKFHLSVDPKDTLLNQCFSSILVKNEQYLVLYLDREHVTTFSTDVYFVKDKSDFTVNNDKMTFYIECIANQIKYSNELKLQIKEQKNELSFDDWRNLIKKDLQQSSLA